MKSKGEAKGVLESIKITPSITEDESLSSAINEDNELIKLVRERENQEEIEVDIDDL